jgi:hypothetical protein
MEGTKKADGKILLGGYLAQRKENPLGRLVWLMTTV